MQRHQRIPLLLPPSSIAPAPSKPSPIQRKPRLSPPPCKARTPLTCGLAHPTAANCRRLPVIVRNVGDRAIVTVIDPARLLPELDENARVLIASPDGVILYASPALQAAGARAQQQVLAAARAGDDGALIRDGNDRTWVAAESTAQIGNLDVMAAAPAPGALDLWLAAFLRFALVTAAPLAAMAVLYLLMRQNAQRARMAEAEAERAETHFQIAADGAKVGVLEWRPSVDEVQLSERAARLLGAPRDVLGLRDLLELIVAEDRFGVEEEFRRARQSGLLDARFRVTRGGGLAWIEARGTAVEECQRPQRNARVRHRDRRNPTPRSRGARVAPGATAARRDR